MIDTVVSELEGFKSKLQNTIEHVKSGQGNLNEDQIAVAKIMLNDLDDDFEDTLHKCHDLLKAALVPPEPEPAVEEPDAAFSSAIAWRAYAANLERVHSLPAIASDETMTDPPPAALTNPVYPAPVAQPVSENLKTVVDEKPDDDSEVVHLDSSWRQHDSAGKEVVVHDDGTGPTAEDLDAHAAEQAAKDATE